jgi:hypothetical protein
MCAARAGSGFELHVFYRDRLTSRSEGERLLLALEGLGPHFLPDRFGRWEPVRQVYDLQAVISAWSWLMLFNKKKPRLSMMSFGIIGPKPCLSSFSIRGTPSRQMIDILPSSAIDLATPFDSTFGYLHSLTPIDLKRGSRSHTVSHAEGREILLIGTQNLVRFLPDVYWGTLFGSAYIELFGRERLLSAPCFKAEEVSPQLIYLQMTEKLSDCLKKPDEVDAVRARVRAHLDCNAIFDPALPSDHEYAVPDFKMQAGL